MVKLRELVDCMWDVQERREYLYSSVFSVGAIYNPHLLLEAMLNLDFNYYNAVKV